MITHIALAAILLLLLTILILIIRSNSRGSNTQQQQLLNQWEQLSRQVQRIEQAVKQEIATNRQEGQETARHGRNELSASLRAFGEQVNKSVDDFNRLQKENFYALLHKQSEQNTATAGRLDQMREVMEKKIADLQSGNEKKLEEMRATVDEKLQKTLETRLGESFKIVSERLEAVHKGLGDMQQLATGVGDLKRVLTNVKTRGIMGEYQLENILDQLLTADQYAKNVKTKADSNAVVEFAVKMPGKDAGEPPVWLPVDSKFPKEDYELLSEAYDNAQVELVEEYRRNFIRGIKKCAADISSKYIHPPGTTDFAILFLPFESLYAEVLRTPGLFETLQRDYKIIITGPTTLSALLSSLQMGFRTLAIERRSGEVWQLLGAVKTEFSNFGGILDKTQKKLQEASNVIDEAGRRSRAIERKLRDVQELPSTQSSNLLDNTI